MAESTIATPNESGGVSVPVRCETSMLLGVQSDVSSRRLERNRPAWKRRRPERSTLYRVVRDRIETFLAARDTPSRPSLPTFVRRAFFAFLRCGIPAHGFLRVRCDGCRREQILPFSCKNRGFCPSCCHRRMLDQQIHLTEAVLPDLPLRQFVFTFPFALRYRIAFDPTLCAQVRRVIMRAIFGSYRQRAARKDLPHGPSGAISVQQRCGSALNTNPHFHILCLDGVFSPESVGLDGFSFLGDPSQADVERLLAVCIARIERLLKRGIVVGGDGDDDPAEQDPELAACLRQGVLDRERIHRRDPTRRRTKVTPEPRRLARDRGYTLHADTAISPFDTARRDMLVRYVLRPPFAASQVELSADGRVCFRLSRPFDDGTTHLVWTKDAFLARLAALIPRPRRHLVTYHGVLAPNHALRARVVPARPAIHAASSSDGPGHEHQREHDIRTPMLRRHATHEQFLLRAYGYFFRRCDHCGGDKRVLAVITDPETIAKILAAIGLDSDPPPRAPPVHDEWHVA